MPEYLAPGVYVEEVSFRARTIPPAAPPVTVFVGPTARGETGVVSPVLKSFAAFKRAFGGVADLRAAGGTRLVNHVAHAARSFFSEGGRALRVVRVAGGDGRAPSLRNYQAAMRRLERVAGLLTVAAPGSSALPGLAAGVRTMLLGFAAANTPRWIVLLDPDPGAPVNEVHQLATGIDAPDAALYYPWVRIRHPSSGRDLEVPPSGPVAGVIARVDATLGLHRSAGSEPVNSAIGLERRVTKGELDRLNPAGVSVLREVTGRGIQVWGGRTLSSDPEWKYLNVRRYAAYIEHSIEQGIDWAVFEPNDEPLWALVRHAVDGFLLDQWRAGALLGSKPEQAWFVRCDRSTMTSADLGAGRLVVTLGIALIKPAEFMVLRIVKQLR
ncbi:MAG: hypothetical protein RLZ44_1850 [Pseudomonadota bacterium]